MWYFLSPIYNAILHSLLQRSKCSHLHAGSCDSRMRSSYLLQRHWVMWSEMFVNFTSNLLCVELEFKYLVGTLGSEVAAMRSLISWFWLCLFLTCLVHPCPGKLPCFLSNSVFACSLLDFWLPDPQSEDLAALWSFTFWIILSLDYCPTDFLRNGLIAGIIINRNCLL